MVGLSQQLDVDVNQISIDTYNLQFDFEKIDEDTNGSRECCTALFDYSYRSNIDNLGKLRKDVGDLRCTVDDQSKNITYKDKNGETQEVNDYKVRIVISDVSNRVYRAFVEGDFRISLN